MSHAQKWQPISPPLWRVQERARANRSEAFTSLAHHLNDAALLRAYRLCCHGRVSLDLTIGSRSIRVTCPEEPDVVTPHVRFCEGESQ